MTAPLTDLAAFFVAMATEPLWQLAAVLTGVLAVGRLIGRRVEAAERDGRVAR